jgi:hypothetical protein
MPTASTSPFASEEAGMKGRDERIIVNQGKSNQTGGFLVKLLGEEKTRVDLARAEAGKKGRGALRVGIRLNPTKSK